MTYTKPSYTITDTILSLQSSIMLALGRLEGLNIVDVSPHLRKINHVKTLHATCAIEGNTLTPDMVTDLIDNKQVLAPKKEIKEIKNALALYNQRSGLDYTSEIDLKKAHGILMQGLLSDAGKYRTDAVGVYAGGVLVHIAPPADLVAPHMHNLFTYLQQEQQTPLLIQSCIFHFEYEFIHPFLDGNGRMGRFWQHLMLTRVHPIFRSTPVENIVLQYQKQYYQALSAAQKAASATPFIEFSLRTINEALQQLEVHTKNKKEPIAIARVCQFVDYLGNNRTFRRKDYMAFFTRLSPLVASKDLTAAVEKGLLKRHGKGNQIYYTSI